MNLAVRAGDLPTYAGRFVGRGAELAEIERLFSPTPAARAVVLVGVAGIGKTRLAAEAGARVHATAKRRAVRWCDLTDASDALDVCAALARAIDLALPPDASFERARAVVSRALAEHGSLVVVLDNFEGVANHAAETLGVWLEAAPKLCALATSRRELDLGRTDLEVRHLALPPLAESFELFVDRARAAGADARWEAAEAPEERETILRALTYLDGLPLALELAAARMGVLAPADLEKALSRSLDVLGQPTRVKAIAEHRRHRSMRAALETSYAALDAPEQRALAAISLFRGSFVLEDLEQVLGSSERPAMDSLQLLVEASFARMSGTIDGHAAFDVPPVVRMFAAEKLAEEADDGVAALLERRFEARFGSVAALLIAATRRGESPARTLSARRENLLVLVERVLARPEAHEDDLAHAAVATAALGALFVARGEPARYRALLARVTAKDAEVPPRAAAELAAAALFTFRSTGELDAACRWAEAAIRRSRELGDDALLSSVLAERSLVQMRRGLLAEAGDDLEAAGLAAARAGNKALAAIRAQYEANVLVRAGDLERAIDRIARALEDAQTLGLPPLEGKIELFYGWILFEKGNVDESLLRLVRARSLCEAHDEQAMAAYATVLAALAAAKVGRMADAAQWTQEGLEGARRFGHPRAEGLALWLRGLIHHTGGKLPAALDDYRDTIRTGVLVGDVWVAPLCYGAQGAAFAEMGQLEAAEQAFARAAEAVASQRGERRYANSKMFLEAMRGVLDAARSERAARDGDALAAETHRREAARILQAAQAHVASPNGSAIREIGIAIRLLERTIDRLAPPDDALLVAASGRWVKPPNAPRIDLERKPVLGKLVLVLAEHHARDEGTALSRRALVEACWPGERIPDELAQNRLAVSLAKLRQLGLRDLLETRGGGPCIRAGARVVCVNDR